MTITEERPVEFRHEQVDAAFVAALGELTDPKATETADVVMRDGGKFKYQYATLTMILSDVRPVLARHGLAVMQLVHTLDGTLAVQTMIRHSSGGTIESGWLMERQPPNPQQLGSLVTYFRRYQLCALLGIAPGGDDDDGRTSATPETVAKRRTRTSKSPPEEPPPPEPPPSTTRPAGEITDAQRRTIMGLFADLGLTGDDMRPARLRFTSDAIGRTVETTNDVTRDEARMLIEALIAETKDERTEP